MNSWLQTCDQILWKVNGVRPINLGGNQSSLLIRICMTLNNFTSDQIFFSDVIIPFIDLVHIVLTEYWKHS